MKGERVSRDLKGMGRWGRRRGGKRGKQRIEKKEGRAEVGSERAEKKEE